MAGIKYEGEFIVGASASTKLAPNFSAREYFAADGSLFVHRDLVSGVQRLRDGAGKVSIESVQPRGIKRGYGVVIKGENSDLLLSLGKSLVTEGVFNEISPHSSSMLVSVSDATAKKGLKPVFAFDSGLQVVANYETQGDPYQQATGNFDGAGISFGIIQYNFKSGTLQQLMRKFKQADEEALRACFTTDQQYSELWKIIDGSISRAIKWGDGISTGRHKHRLNSAWNRVFRAIGRVEEFRRIQLEFAYEKYGKLLMEALAFLEGLTRIKIRNHLCLTALFDMCIQQGGYKKATSEIVKRVERENPADELTLTHITVEERAKLASKKYRADCLSRRLGILYRQPKSVTLNGHTSRRTNRKTYLLKDVNVNGVEKYLHPELLRDVG